MTPRSRSCFLPPFPRSHPPNTPIPQFDAAYWHVFDTLESNRTPEQTLRTHPGYFRFLMLIALHVFSTHVFPDGNKVDVILLEVGMGGRYDPTNVFEYVDACAVTKVRNDEMRQGNACARSGATQTIKINVYASPAKSSLRCSHSKPSPPLPLTRRFAPHRRSPSFSA